MLAECTAGCTWSTDPRCTLRNHLTAGELAHSHLPYFKEGSIVLFRRLLTLLSGGVSFSSKLYQTVPIFISRLKYVNTCLSCKVLSGIWVSRMNVTAIVLVLNLHSMSKNIYISIMRKMSLWDRSQMLTCASETVVRLD